jgi:hypothetical protein
VRNNDLSGKNCILIMLLPVEGRGPVKQACAVWVQVQFPQLGTHQTHFHPLMKCTYCSCTVLSIRPACRQAWLTNPPAPYYCRLVSGNEELCGAVPFNMLKPVSPAC